MSDDGRLPWSELSGTEKAARATQQSFNFVVVLIGAVMTVSWFLAIGFEPKGTIYLTLRSW